MKQRVQTIDREMDREIDKKMTTKRRCAVQEGEMLIEKGRCGIKHLQ